MTKTAAALGALLLAITSAAPAHAQRIEREEAGVLDCDVSGGIGLIITSRKQVRCLFSPSTPGPQEVYVGTISKFGLDLGVTAGGRMVWAVHVATNRRRGALDGVYTGASAEATIGAGLGANVLVGGSDRTVALQPLSVQGQAGLNVAAGVAELDLQVAR